MFIFIFQLNLSEQCIWNKFYITNGEQKGGGGGIDVEMPTDIVWNYQNEQSRHGDTVRCPRDSQCDVITICRQDYAYT